MQKDSIRPNLHKPNCWLTERERTIDSSCMHAMWKELTQYKLITSQFLVNTFFVCAIPSRLKSTKEPWLWGKISAEITTGGIIRFVYSFTVSEFLQSKNTDADLHKGWSQWRAMLVIISSNCRTVEVCLSLRDVGQPGTIPFSYATYIQGRPLVPCKSLYTPAVLVAFTPHFPAQLTGTVTKAQWILLASYTVPPVYECWCCQICRTIVTRGLQTCSTWLTWIKII